MATPATAPGGDLRVSPLGGAASAKTQDNADQPRVKRIQPLSVWARFSHPPHGLIPIA